MAKKNGNGVKAAPGKSLVGVIKRASRAYNRGTSKRNWTK